MKEIIQSIIPVISAFSGAVLTFYFQRRLISRQLEAKKEIIKFEKKREALAELKSYQLRIIHLLIILNEQDKLLKNNSLPNDNYIEIYDILTEQLCTIVNEALTLYNKQLYFQVEGLYDLYLRISYFLSHFLFKDFYTTDINKIYPLKDTYESLINESEELLDKIIKTAENKVLSNHFATNKSKL